MKLRLFFIMSFAVLFLTSFVFAQDKADCSAKTASAKKSSCCMQGAKASLTSDTKSSDKSEVTVHIMSVNNPNTDDKTAHNCEPGSKECNMKTAKMSSDCTAAEKANCDMAKSGKITMKKTSGKMDCCKAKNVEAKNTNSKSKQSKSTADAKGTN